MADEKELTGGKRSRVTLETGTVVESSLPATVTARVRPARRRSAQRSATPPAERDTLPGFESALAEVGIREQETIYVDVAPVRRRMRAADDRVVIAPAPSPKGVQVILYVDESGGMSWHLPDGHGKRKKTARRAGTGRPRARFTIDTRTAAARSSLGQQRGGSVLRGPITKLGRKIFKVLVVPIGSKILARPVASIVGKIERRHRQELVRSLTPGNYRKRETIPFTGWKKLAKGRTLLVIHGIFSSTEGMLSQLPETAMRELDRLYEGRVIAFDQITVSRSPDDNARFFLQQVREAAVGMPIEFDILCHSRGGIVSRLLAEHGAELDPQADALFRKIYFVATPNAGSVLADPDHIVDMIDVFTNLATDFPDGPITYSIEVLLSIIKLLVATAERNLPGLAAMGTSGFIDDLNNSPVASTAAYAAASANYEPDPRHDNGFFTGRFADSIVDRVFAQPSGDVANDLVVPRDGVFGDNGHPSFPISGPLIFEEADRVWHSGFFANERAIQHFVDFLGDHHAAARPAAEPSPPGLESRDTLLPPPHPPRSAAPRHATANGGGGRRTRGVRKSRARKSAGRARKRSRAPETSSSDTAPAVNVKRNPHIDFHELVEAGKKLDLVVRLTDAVTRANLRRAIDIEIGHGQDSVNLTVSLSAPGFKVSPRKEQKLTVGREFDAGDEKVTFQLTALSPGSSPVSREIRAMFWLGQTSVGAVVHHTTVIPAGYRGPASGDGRSTSSPLDLDSPRQECELVVRVEGIKDAGKGPYRVSLRGKIPGEDPYESRPFGTFDLPKRELAQNMKLYFERFASAYPENPTKANLARWRAERIADLETLGKWFWKQLPQEFRNEYFRLHDAGRLPASIQIYSDEMSIPWELIVPFRSSGRRRVLDPLGVAHVMGRWTPQLGIRPSPQRMAVKTGFIVNPTYSGQSQLLWSIVEAGDLKKLVPLFQDVRPADRASVRKLLKRRDVQLLHYAGHGEYASHADLSALVLQGDDKLAAMDFVGANLVIHGKPIIYLNACEAGNSDVVMGQMGGFAAACVQSGCSGIIAPYWAIADESARDFSIAFYNKLLRGRAIGEALQELRKDNRKDPTFRAFTYVGDPWTRPQLSGP